MKNQIKTDDRVKKIGEILAIKVFSCIYGIDIMKDNIVEARQRLYDAFFFRFVNHYHQSPSQPCLGNIQFIKYGLNIQEIEFIESLIMTLE